LGTQHPPVVTEPFHRTASAPVPARGVWPISEKPSEKLAFSIESTSF
jgi:hypothetical protein